MGREKISGIYCVENIINHKKYIGQGKNLLGRLNDHKNHLRRQVHCNEYLQNAYNKYGSENFIYYIIQELPSDKKILNLMEIYWIAYFNSFMDDGGGYNLTRGGEGLYKSSVSTTEKRKRLYSGENASFYGRKHTEETKKRMSESAIGRVTSEETKKKISMAKSGDKNPLLGTHHSEETNKKISESNKKFWENKSRVMSDETKAKITASSLGRKREGSSSKYRGPCWNKTSKSWSSRIRYQKRYLSLGYYKSEVEGAMAYNEAALELYGPNAVLNDISQEEIGALWLDSNQSQDDSGYFYNPNE